MTGSNAVTPESETDRSGHGTIYTANINLSCVRPSQAHYISDYPEENDREWLKNIVISKKNGELSLSTVPVDQQR
jgi:hypothetical protein